MGAEDERAKAEQKAFANAALTLFLGFIGWMFAAAVAYLVQPLFKLMPPWAMYSGAAALVVSLVYMGIVLVRLGGVGTTSMHRDWYVAFRKGIAADHVDGRYAQGVTRVLDAVDRFYDGKDPQRLGLFPRAFGLQQARPLWTAKSFDTSLLVALVYPLLAIVLCWTVWGNVGPAEGALLLRIVPESQRYFAVGALTISFGLTILVMKTQISAWLKAVTILAFMAVTAFAGAFGLGTVTIACIVVYMCRNATRELEGQGGFAALLAIIAAYFGYAIGGTIGGMWSPATGGIGAGLGSSILMIIVAFAVTVGLEAIYGTRRSGIVFLVFGAFLLVACLTLIPTGLMAINPNRGSIVGLYFLALLTLLNAPFDWVALGITRGLVRRGQEKGGAWPIAFAAFDFLSSIVLMAILALLMLWATEIYNWTLTDAGTRIFLDPQVYITALGHAPNRSLPAFYWLYALLLSSQIPAIVNFAIGALCLLRGLPIANRWMLARLPEQGMVDSWSRLGVAVVSAAQMFLAVFLACCLYALMALVLIRLLNPLVGNQLLEGLRAMSLAAMLG